MTYERSEGATRLQAKGRALALLSALLLSACVVSEQTLVESACNGWVAALEPGVSRQETLEILGRSIGNAEQAAETVPQYRSLASALRDVRDGIDKGDLALVERGTNKAFDECFEIMDTEEYLREEIKRMEGGG